jgi:hypothetical protein
MPKRIDSNHHDIVEALRAIGATVQSLATIGKGCPDILVGYQGRNYAIEIKTLSGRLTQDEVEWISKWDGHVRVIRSAEEAVKIVRGEV